MLGWLEDRPDIEAKETLKRLQGYSLWRREHGWHCMMRTHEVNANQVFAWRSVKSQKGGSAAHGNARFGAAGTSVLILTLYLKDAAASGGYHSVVWKRLLGEPLSALLNVSL